MWREVIDELRRFNEVVERGEPLEDHFVVRRYLMRMEPRKFSAAGVKAVRKRMGMSQVVFARVLAVSPATVRAWERQGARSPMARRLLEAIEPWWASVHARHAGAGRKAG